MDYIWKEYKAALPVYIIVGGLLALFAPWMTGPFIADWIGTVLGASFFYLVMILARATYLTFIRRNDSNKDG